MCLGVSERENHIGMGAKQNKDKVYSLFFNIVSFFYLAPFRGGVVGRVLFVIPE